MKKLLKEVLPKPVIDGLRNLRHPTKKLQPFSKRVPEHLRRNFLSGDAATLNRVEQSIRQHYHAGWRAETTYSPEVYQNDLADHLTRRLSTDRTIIIPWLDAARPLHGQRILEVGCGTGSSTLALAEQGACVTGIDVDEGALIVARDRCSAYGAKAEFRVLNAEMIAATFGSASFDHVIFFAALEHMTIPERLASLAAAWTLLPPGGLLTIVETPNRLWHHDTHTSFLPLFHWLPNELAFHYSRMSPRENFRNLYRDYDQASEQHFLRRGRGMSFHEIDLAIAPVTVLDVVSSLGPRRPYSATSHKFKAILKELNATLHDGFFDEYLDIIIRKTNERPSEA